MWKKILINTATAAITTHPAGAAVLTAVNAFLPDDKKLPESTTGQQVRTSIDALPERDRLALYDRLADIEINESNNFASNVEWLAKADMSGNSTRPEIALMMAKLVCAVTLILCSAVAIALIKDNVNSLKEMFNGWPLVLALVATPTALLKAYFGLRTREKEARYLASNGAMSLDQSKSLWSKLGL